MPRAERAESRKFGGRTFLRLKAGNVCVDFDRFLERLFWKNPAHIMLGKELWRTVRDCKKEGWPVESWKEWRKKWNISTGRFYRVAHILEGAGMIERRESRWFVSSGLMRELEQILYMVSAETGWESRIARYGGHRQCFRCGAAVGECPPSCECKCGAERDKFHA